MSNPEKEHAPLSLIFGTLLSVLACICAVVWVSTCGNDFNNCEMERAK